LSSPKSRNLKTFPVARCRTTHNCGWGDGSREKSSSLDEAGSELSPLIALSPPGAVTFQAWQYLIRWCNAACNAVQPACHFEKWALHSRGYPRWHKAPWHQHKAPRATAVQTACMSVGPAPLIPLGRKPALKGCSLRAGSPYLVEAKPREHPPLAWPRPRRARPPSAHRSRQDRPSAR
jgi:hypothetical protein